MHPTESDTSGSGRWHVSAALAGALAAAIHHIANAIEISRGFSGPRSCTLQRTCISLVTSFSLWFLMLLRSTPLEMHARALLFSPGDSSHQQGRWWALSRSPRFQTQIDPACPQSSFFLCVCSPLAATLLRMFDQLETVCPAWLRGKYGVFAAKMVSDLVGKLRQSCDFWIWFCKNPTPDLKPFSKLKFN